MTAADTAPTHQTAEHARRPDLLERLLSTAYRFDFFQAVWLLERYRPGSVPVGRRGPVAAERLRFRPGLSMGFPPTDVGSLTEFQDPSRRDPNYLIEVLFMGLYGVSTPLPLHYATDFLRSVERGVPSAADTADEGGPAQRHERPPNGSPTRDFVDVFHHRVVSLFYRSWLKYRYERMFGQPDRDVITSYLLSLIGCPAAYDAPTLGVNPIYLLRYAGVLTQKPRSAITLQGVLHDYLDLTPVKVRQFVGQWVTLSESDLNRIGEANCVLGGNLTVGEQVYDLGGAFCITIGPVNWQTYVGFVPGGRLFSQIRALTKLYCCDPLTFNIEVRLLPNEVPETQLTSDATSGRLGLTSWVRTGPMGETAETFDARADASAAPGVFVAPPATAKAVA